MVGATSSKGFLVSLFGGTGIPIVLKGLTLQLARAYFVSVTAS